GVANGAFRDVSYTITGCYRKYQVKWYCLQNCQTKNKMKLNLKENHVLILIGWFIINLLQAVFTGLHSDESYYWMYSENLAFGYFDHPPFVAYLIHLGYSLVGG